MFKYNEGKEVDGYVSGLIEHYSKELELEMDPKKPARQARLNMALKLDEKGDHASQWSAMEIMVGRRIDSSEEIYGMLFMMYKLGTMDKMKFYDGFPE